MQLEAFMGGRPGYAAGSMDPQRATFIGATKWAVTQFTDKQFVFDRNAGMSDIHVAEYAQLAAADRAAGTYEASMAKLVSFARATSNALKLRLSSLMTDKTTEDVVGIIGRMNLVLEITAQNFPSGIPTATATEIDNYMREINDFATQISNKRTSDYTKITQQYPQAIALEQKILAEPAYVPPTSSGAQVDTGTSSSQVDTGIPGGGAAGSAGQVIDDGGQPVMIEKTAAQKYGPVLALVAGGIVAYFALKG